jgi:membrane-associated protease RseP (regulator of RpoE activity)
VVPANSKEANLRKCPADARRAPAYHRLQPGDTILAVDGTAIRTWPQLVSIIEHSAGQPLHLRVNRDGALRTLSVTPVETVKFTNPTEKRTMKAGFLGVTPSVVRSYPGLAAADVPGKVGTQIGQALDAVGRFPSKIGSLWGTVFEGKKRNLNSPVGIVGIGRISGDFASSPAFSVQDKIYTLLGLLASVNLLLFFFNLLPLLPLDGGHVAGAIVESVRRGWSRLRLRMRSRRPSLHGPPTDGIPARPQIFVDTAQMLPVMYAVASVLFVLTLLTLWADIFKPINPLGG